MKQKLLFQSLKSKRDITTVFEAGEKIYSKNILLRFISDSTRDSLPLHVLLALPKKKLGAVGRNRLRRICKSALYQAMKKIKEADFNAPANSFNIVIHARENFADIPEKDRVLEFENLISRLFKMGQNPV